MRSASFSTARSIVALGLLCVWTAVLAPGASADELDAEVRSVARRLQCPICESVSVADSPSELAGQMRALIRVKLEQGESGDQIVAYFVERYGESVLVEPPRHGVGLLVWLGPIVALLLGGAALTFWLRSGRGGAVPPGQRPQRAPAAATDWQLHAAQRELDEMTGGRSA